MNRLIIAGILCVALAANASAADPAKKGKKKVAPDKGPDIALLFNKLDTNNDKKLSLQEFEAFNGLNGENAKKAAKAAKAKKPNKSVKKAAKVAQKAKKPNKAGKAKKAKKGAKPSLGNSVKAQWFKKLDVNNDNYLSLDEFTKIKEVVGEMAKKKKK